MSYFPFFVELEGVSGLLVGGGIVARHKVEKLLPYGPCLTVVAPEIHPDIVACAAVTPVLRTFHPEDLDGKSFVLAAANREVHRQVSALCRSRGIPVNAVDQQEDCTFLFPALVKQGTLSVGISTGGASPTAAAYVKDQLNTLLPDNFGELLDFLGSLRPQLKQQIPEETRRAQLFAALFDACLQAGRPLSGRQVQGLMNSLSSAEDQASN